MDKWEPNCPNSLEDLCINYFINNIFRYLVATDDSYCLRPGITFPQGLSDKILLGLAQNSQYLEKQDPNLFGIFNNRASTVLTELPLRFTAVTEEDLDFLCLHPVREIDITYCPELRTKFVKALNQAANTLRVLRLGGNDQVERLDCLLSDESVWPTGSGDASSSDAIFTLPYLRILVLRDIRTFSTMDGVNLESVPLLDRVIQPLKGLTHLDLCECILQRRALEKIGELDLPNLVSLSLSDVLNGCETALRNICNFTKLRHLDISQGDENNHGLPINYTSPTNLLRNLLDSMPYLTSLDISGTNLAGYMPIHPVSHKLTATSTPPDDEVESLPGNDDRRFKFLGLVNCADTACHRKGIPSDKVTGDANEEQILTAVHVYRDRPTLLTQAFNFLFNKFRYETVTAQYSALEGILAGMMKNKHDKQVQISGSASLFYIVKGSNKGKITQKQKRNIIDCLLNAMERHITDPTMLRNGCLTLCHFNIPVDVLYCYNRLVIILLNILRGGQTEEFLQRLSLFLLNSLACQVEGEQKQALGDMGTIEVMCKIIGQRLENKTCDEILEVCWSTLWNVTDETESNCDRFMKNNGMYLFLDCFKIFPTKEELLRSMMGLMGNIAEVASLRHLLMNDDYVTVFTNFLESTKDGIEVSYNAAGVLAHLLSDGKVTWKVSRPEREEVIRRITQAIQRWPLDSRRNINYRSFVPILRLVRCHDSPASQYWSVWALCNLTQVYPEKYCMLLRDEKGLDYLQEVLMDPRPSQCIKDLAYQVIHFVNTHQHLQPSKSVEVEMVEINGELDG